MSCYTARSLSAINARDGVYAQAMHAVIGQIFFFAKIHPKRFYLLLLFFAAAVDRSMNETQRPKREKGSKSKGD